MDLTALPPSDKPTEPETYLFRGADGATFLTLTAEEAPRMLAILITADAEDPLSAPLASMRDQLAEFVEPSPDA